MENTKQLNALPISYISAFCMEVSMMLKAGMPLDHGILSMIDDEKTKDGRLLLQKIYDILDEGSSFSDALAQTGLFPYYMVNMVDVGEKTGHLEETLYSLYEYYKKEEVLRASVKSAVLYPMIMVAMMFVVLMALVMKILPMFNEVYYAMGSSVPPAAIITMKVGNVVCIAALIILAIVVVCNIISAIFNKVTGKPLFNFIEKVTAKSAISEIIAVSRFTSVMSMTLSSGLELEYGIDLALKLITHKTTQAKISECKKMVDNGEAFSDAIEKSGLVRGTYAGLLNVGFKTGSSDTVMEELSQRYSQEVDAKIASLVSAIEPTLVISLSVLVGVILLLVMMPLMGIMSSL